LRGDALEDFSAVNGIFKGATRLSDEKPRTNGSPGDRKEDRRGLKAAEVFVPGAYPQHTYVERAAQGFEETLRDSLNTPGQVVSLSGPSKSGKTVLVERVVGRDSLIPISGASLRRPEDV
jgi:hypothetical protein